MLAIPNSVQLVGAKAGLDEVDALVIAVRVTRRGCSAGRGVVQVAYD